jgi:hypothetical protein
MGRLIFQFAALFIFPIIMYPLIALTIFGLKGAVIILFYLFTYYTTSFIAIAQEKAPE